MRALQRITQIGQDVDHLLWEMAYIARRPRISQGGGGERVASRGATDTHIDTPRIQCLQDTKVLRHFQGAVMGQHDSPTPHPDRARTSGNLANEDLRAGASEIPQIVMLRHPEAPITQRFGRHCHAMVSCRASVAVPPSRTGD